MATEKDRVPLSSEASQAPMPAGAVFLSYASEDAAAAERIATALRNAGIEVWFDREELRGGDAWDRRIREQIHDCRLFIAVISAQTEARDEGYFRREWKLAVDRTHDMAEKKAFIVPVVIDGTSERGASVPEKFRELQWTRLSGGETSPTFVWRIQKLLVPEAPTQAAAPTPSGSTRAPASKTSLHPTWPSNIVLWVISALLAVGLTYLIAVRLWHQQQPQATPATQKPASSTSENPSTVAAFNPPPHSIAVLPFVNMSGDKEQEYFSDGLSEELLNSLARINELQVAARTSSFYFKGKDVDLNTIAHKLNVASVLEGSVRRSGNMIRVTAQLNNAVTGFHLWSQTYDRDLGDVLKLQTEIATAVATALRVTLLGDEGTKIELGGTRNPAAFDAYLRGSKPLSNLVGDAASLQAAIVAFTEAIRLDPDYALAFADRALLLGRYASEYGTDPATVGAGFENALIDARQAIALAPELPEGYRALAYIQSGIQQYVQASEAYERALALAPGNARVLPEYSRFAAYMGRADAGIAAGRRSASLDPLSSNSHFSLGAALRSARRYAEAVAAFNGALALEPENPRISGFRGLAYYGLGDLQGARSSCKTKPGNWVTQWCLALVYDKLGRHADAEAELADMKATGGDGSAYQYATIYAQWGKTPQALEWLETALRVRDPGLIFLKTDSLLDPLRNEPRFQAIERALKFPD